MQKAVPYCNIEPLFLIKFHEKEGVFIYTERYSDFNSMIEKYEKEMRRLFEEKHKDSFFEEPAKQAAVFPEDTPEISQFQQKEQSGTEIPEPIIMPQMPNTKEPAPNQNDISKTGSIIAEVTTARGAVPLAGVTVLIDRFDVSDKKGRKELIAVKTTNKSGRTEPVYVEAQERELSLEPGTADPFTTFYLSAQTKGFEPVKDRPVDVFADEVSILKIDLIPIPENLGGGGTV